MNAKAIYDTLNSAYTFGILTAIGFLLMILIVKVDMLLKEQRSQKEKHHQ